MSEHPIQGILSTALHNIKEMIDVNTIVGTPVTAEDGTVIIPVSRVSFGFAAGGSEFGGKKEVKNEESKANFGGGSGAGVSIVPVAFLVVGGGNVRLLTLTDNSSSVSKIIDMVPDILSKFKETIDKKCDKRKNKDKAKEDSIDNLDDIIITE